MELEQAAQPFQVLPTAFVDVGGILVLALAAAACVCNLVCHCVRVRALRSPPGLGACKGRHRFHVELCCCLRASLDHLRRIATCCGGVIRVPRVHLESFVHGRYDQ